jgi:hypothetical protein
MVPRCVRPPAPARPWLGMPWPPSSRFDQRTRQRAAPTSVRQSCCGSQFPKQWLFRPISIAAASWRRVVDGFDKTAETASHFVGALSRSPAHAANMKANSRTMSLIRTAYPYWRFVSGFSGITRPRKGVAQPYVVRSEFRYSARIELG